ncbi:hypothetical protein PVK06_048203 [Gossypium arboreum]|uniref:Uncharacterized protein n=1 Tax=Gossypium arboreum TaxID=29729 RepID=A0ABR0MHB0_GOSAR|nr:hypothetical protein PVK06_048203 [Gossypium arboreum]
MATPINASIDTHINVDVSRFCNIIRLFVDSVINTHHIDILLMWVIGATTFSWSGEHMMRG